MNPIARCLLMIALLAGAAPAFADFRVQANGTVLDATSGLVWDRCSIGQTGAACDVPRPDGGWVSFDAAQRAVVRANRNRHKGHDDWRLPTFAELNSVVRAASSPDLATIDATAFPATAPAPFWTPTLATSPEPSRVAVDFALGTSMVVPAAAQAQVRLVRSGGVGVTSAQALAPSASHVPVGPLASLPLLVLALPGVRGTWRRKD